MLKRGDKKGQELSTNVIILIILGVVVLVVLILGFTVGWKKIAPWISSTNVDSIVTQCGVACSTGNAYDYCIAKKDLKSADETLKDVTCYYLSEKQTKYGITKCPSVCTNVILSDVTSEADARNVCSQNGPGKMVYYMQDKTLKFYDCSEPG